MNSSLIDSTIFKNAYSTEKMRKCFNDSSRIQSWLDVEAALARAQAKLGIIPVEAAQEINRKANWKNLDFKEMQEIYEQSGHPIMPIIYTLKKVCEQSWGEYIHWGATTQDIMDTGCILQIRNALPIIEGDMKKLRKICMKLAGKHKDTLQSGRTHGQHAVPITFGYKVAIWTEEINRHLKRLEQCKPRLFILEFAGAAGTLATINQEKAFALQKTLAKELSLKVPSLPWHVSRDHLVELCSILAYVSGSCCKIANEIIALQRTEIAELEQAQAGRIGSSTMPHKRNPIQFEHVVVLDRYVRNNANAMLENLQGEHERDWRTWGSEMKIIEESFLITSALLEIMVIELNRLKINEKNMHYNLNILNGLIMSERVMMKLAEKLGRQTAHDIVHMNAMRAFEEKKSFAQILKEDNRVAKVLSEQEIDDLMDPSTYVGLAPKYVEELIKRENEEA